MMKELTRNEMEMIYGGAGIVVWPGNEKTTVCFPVFALICPIPNDQLVKIC